MTMCIIMQVPGLQQKSEMAVQTTPKQKAHIHGGVRLMRTERHRYEQPQRTVHFLALGSMVLHQSGSSHA